MKVTVEPIVALPPPRKFIIELTEDELLNMYALCMSVDGDMRRELAFPLMLKISQAVGNFPTPVLYGEEYSSELAERCHAKWLVSRYRSRAATINRRR